MNPFFRSVLPDAVHLLCSHTHYGPEIGSDTEAPSDEVASYLAVASGRACAARAVGGWTAVIARAPGPILLRARFSLERALGLLAACGQRARV